MGAEVALKLAETPETFLSTVQIGITLIGVLLGAFGGTQIATQIADVLATIPLLSPYAEQLALAWWCCSSPISRWYLVNWPLTRSA